MAGEDIAADCEEASMRTGPGGAGDVSLTADVVDGATVSPGDDILLRLTWDPEQWSGPRLDRVLDCVEVKGQLAPDLSAEEQPTENDGVFEYRLHIPDDIRPGCDVCAEGFVAGMTDGGGFRQVRSERYCFMSGPPGPPTPPVTRPPATEPPPTPPIAAAAPPPRVPTEVPTEVGGITASGPGANPGVPGANPGTEVTAPAAELPRTGAPGRREAAGGGVALALGGLAVMGGSARRTRRRTGV
jgi:hypothetical protein